MPKTRSYTIRIRKSVKREIDNLPGHIRQRVRRLIEYLAQSPNPQDAKELRDLPGYYRIRLDRWRVVYRLDRDVQEVVILAVKRKAGPETYEDLE